jgi:hypothetical protein
MRGCPAASSASPISTTYCSDHHARQRRLSAVQLASPALRLWVIEFGRNGEPRHCAGVVLARRVVTDQLYLVCESFNLVDVSGLDKELDLPDLRSHEHMATSSPLRAVLVSATATIGRDRERRVTACDDRSPSRRGVCVESGVELRVTVDIARSDELLDCVAHRSGRRVVPTPERPASATTGRSQTVHEH